MEITRSATSRVSTLCTVSIRLKADSMDRDAADSRHGIRPASSLISPIPPT
jgi:hypothetical protein